jgi:hypothetical protein
MHSHYFTPTIQERVGHVMAQLLEALNYKIEGSIPDGVTGICN